MNLKTVSTLCPCRKEKYLNISFCNNFHLSVVSFAFVINFQKETLRTPCIVGLVIASHSKLEGGHDGNSFVARRSGHRQMFAHREFLRIEEPAKENTASRSPAESPSTSTAVSGIRRCIYIYICIFFSLVLFFFLLSWARAKLRMSRGEVWINSRLAIKATDIPRLRASHERGGGSLCRRKLAQTTNM